MASRPIFVTDKAKRALIIAGIRRGLPQGRALALADLQASAWSYWKKRAAEGVEDYVEFFEEVDKAAAEFVAETLANISEHSRKSWQAGAWLLERRYPNEWAQRRPDAQYTEDDLRDLMQVLAESQNMDSGEQARILGTFNERLAAKRAAERDAKTAGRSRKKRA